MNKEAKEITKKLSDKSGVYAIKHNDKVIFIGTAFSNTKLTVNQLINRLKRNDNTQLSLKKYYNNFKTELSFIQLEVCDKELLKDRSDYFKKLYEESLIRFYEKNNTIKKAVDGEILNHLSVYNIAALYKRNVESVRRAIRKSPLEDNNLRKKNKTLLYSKEYVENIFGNAPSNSVVEDSVNPIYISHSHQKNESNSNLNQSIVNEFSRLEVFKNWLFKLIYNFLTAFKNVL